MQKYARSEYHTQLAKVSFDEIFDLTAGVYFYFSSNNRRPQPTHEQLQVRKIEKKMVFLEKHISNLPFR